MSWTSRLWGALNSESLNRRLPFALFLFTGTVLLFVISNVFHIPLAERPLLFAGIAFLLGLIFAILLLLYSVASCISEEIMYLAAETRREAGAADGNVAEAIQVFTALFDFYDQMLRRRPNASLLVTLFGANRAMRRARKRIINPGKESPLAVIHSAGDELARFCERLHEERFGYLYSHAKRFISPDPELAAEASKAIQDFHTAANGFVKNLNFRTAHAACIQSRRSGFFLHCAWPEYSAAYGRESRELSDFASDLQQTILAIDKIAPDTVQAEQQLLEKYAKSLRRRLEALQALTREDRPSVWKALQAA